MNNNDILFLLNPLSDEGRSKSKWERLRRRFDIFPEKPYEVSVKTDFLKLFREKEPKIVAIAGGDGTINLICQAVLKLKTKPTLAILPFGFGNALAHCLGVENIEKAADVLERRPNTVTIDLLKTNLEDKEIGIFNISAGFDARIIHIRDNYRYIGLRSYAISGIRGLLTHPEKEIKFTIDHKVSLNATASSLVIANCPIIGQNYVIAQAAKLDDGLLDCTLFSSKYAYLSNMRLKGFKHPFYSEMGKVHFKAKHILIEGEPFIQIDGDPVTSPRALEISILPAQLTFLRNDKKNIDILYQPFI